MSLLDESLPTAVIYSTAMEPLVRILPVFENSDTLKKMESSDFIDGKLEFL